MKKYYLIDDKLLGNFFCNYIEGKIINGGK